MGWPWLHLQTWLLRTKSYARKAGAAATWAELGHSDHGGWDNESAQVASGEMVLGMKSRRAGLVDLGSLQACKAMCTGNDSDEGWSKGVKAVKDVLRGRAAHLDAGTR